MTGVGVITDFDGGRRIAADNGTHTALAEGDDGGRCGVKKLATAVA